MVTGCRASRITGGCGTQPPQDGGKGTQPPYRPPTAAASGACEAGEDCRAADRRYRPRNLGPDPGLRGLGPRSSAGAVKGGGISLSAREGLSRTGEAGSQAPGPAGTQWNWTFTAQNALEPGFHGVMVPGPSAARTARCSARCSVQRALLSERGARGDCLAAARQPRKAPSRTRAPRPGRGREG